MITVSEALNIIINNLPNKRVENKPLLESSGYIMAENIFSDIDLPPFNKSAMDGYAVRAVDIRRPPVELELIETIAAGEQSRKVVKPGKTIKIMTGAPVPAGADAVVIKETTDQKGNIVRFAESIKKDANICYQGEDLKKGEKLLSAGCLIKPAEIGVLAAAGKSSLKVFRKPSVAILTTGDELVEINTKPQGARIRNSNTYFLMAQMYQLGLCPDNLGIARDDAKELTNKIKSGLKRDILIITGGVSVGEYDIVEPVLSKLGVKILFNKVAIKPGKPFVFGVKNGKGGKCLIFALPGNPVSAFVITEIFIRPAVAKLTDNISLQPRTIKAKLGEASLKTSNREQYVPAQYNSGSGVVVPVLWHGSADMIALTHANALIIIPPDRRAGSPPIPTGESIQIIILE